MLGRLRQSVLTAKQHPHRSTILAICAVVGPQRASTEPLELALYARDAGVAEGAALAVCWPRSTEEVAAAVRVARRHERPFVARGSGTGLAGGATPLGDPVVIVTTQMNRVLEVDPDARVAWVEPGVLNLDLPRTVRHLGLHYAPDPSSQQACTIGGNVATNAGGPHCLAAGVTSAHILAVEVVLPDGQVAVLGGLEPDAARLRPPRVLRRLRGHDGHRDPCRGAPVARPAHRRARCCAPSDRSRPRPRPSAGSSPPASSPPRWR